ncbi:MAG: hypothetical protein II984_07480 [Clostridia bacterium]|nr:hypothetical protein [Clostridia bacterium]
MKNLFCQQMDFMTNKILDEGLEVAKIKKIDERLTQAAYDIEKKINKIKEEKIALVIASFVIHFIAIFIGVIIDKLFLVLALALVSGLMVGFLILIKYKSNVTFNLKYELDKAKKDIYNSLGVPKTARKIDVLFDAVDLNGRKASHYKNKELLVYKEGKNLCFASKVAIYSIPISSIKKVNISDKKEEYQGWNKIEPEDHEAYANSIYIRYNRKGTLKWTYMINSRHIEILLNDEEYEIIIPNYDIAEFEYIYMEF